MDPNELAKFRAVSEIARNYRRQNNMLREALGQQTQERKQFDAENVELFAVVHRNHRRNEV